VWFVVISLHRIFGPLGYGLALGLRKGDAQRRQPEVVLSVLQGSAWVESTLLLTMFAWGLAGSVHCCLVPMAQAYARAPRYVRPFHVMQHGASSCLRL
jgi:hypothetical protein